MADLVKKERPILFSAALVAAIMAGQKTQTRRQVKDAPRTLHLDPRRNAAMRAGFAWFSDDPDLPGNQMRSCPYGQPGDRLYVRESCWIYGQWHKNGLTKTGRQKWRFEATGQQVSYEPPGMEKVACWGTGPGFVFRPSIHVPRWASRLLLEIVSVRVEQLRDITESDAIAEGIERRGDKFEVYGHDRYYCEKTARDTFCNLWCHIYGDDSWHANPWVWVVEFKVVQP